jgi:hypothetical protein
LASRYKTSKSELEGLEALCDRIALPLRLATASRALLFGLKVGQGTEDDVIPEGLDTPALEPAGNNYFVALTEIQCHKIEKALPILSYNPELQLPIDYFTDGHYQMSPSESGLSFLLSLEILFSSGLAHQNENRVAHMSSVFSSFDPESRKRARKLITEAYLHRATLRHGETDVSKIQAAHDWFGEYAWELKAKNAFALQRVLYKYAADKTFDLGAHILGHKGRQHDEAIQKLPIVWVDHHQSIIRLDMPQGTVISTGGGSVELIPHGPN